MVAVSVYCQSNPAEQSFTVVPGQTFEAIIESGYREAKPLLEEGFDFSIVDGSFEKPSSNGSNKTKISFKVSEEFLGKRTSLVVEYTAGQMAFSPINYTTLHFYVKESYIKTTHDYKSISIGDQNVKINVLDNDESSHGGLMISDIAHKSDNIDARIENNRLVFSANGNRGGMAYVNYIATNIEGATALGTVTICILNPDNVEPEATLRYITSNQNPLIILLPVDNLDFDGDEPRLGSAEFIGDDVIEYKPNSNQTGTDLFKVKSGDIVRNIEVKVYKPRIDDGSVKDDVVYTEIGKPVQFNIFDNDILSEDGMSLQSISNEDGFTHLGGGEVYFEPSARFSGVKNYEYTVDKGVGSETGKIKIIVGGFFPEPLSTYRFVTKKNTPFIINYSIPIDDYSFSPAVSPANGAMNFSNVGAYDYDCGQAIGNNMIIYDPNDDYVGMDHFELSYQVNGEFEQLVNIEVEVIESDDCGCAGSDCIWPGDANNDGKVFITDLLTLGHNFGAVGQSREDHIDWIANDGDDWGDKQVDNDIDQKFVDANGDGMVNMSDVDLIKDNYNKYHNLVSNQVLTIKDYPFTIIPSATEVDSGDWLELEIHLGSEDYPVLDVHGLAYTLHIDPAVYDSSSLQVQYYDQPWFGSNSPTIHMHVQPIDGRVDIGSTRITGETTSGKGIIHKLGIIIEEDVDGFDPGTKDVKFPITISNISMTNSLGETVQLGDVETSVTLNLSQDVESQQLAKESELFIFPNPTSDIVNIHLNGQDVIESISIYDLSGKMVYNNINLNTDKIGLDVRNFNEGTYISRVTTVTNVISKKFNVTKK